MARFLRVNCTLDCVKRDVWRSGKYRACVMLHTGVITVCGAIIAGVRFACCASGVIFAGELCALLCEVR